MRAIDELIQEHHGIQQMLKVLGALVHKLRAGETVDYAHLDRITEFFTVFVDRCHHSKEEDYLFPALEACGIRREGGPIGVMLSEHAQGRELVARMRAVLRLLHDGQSEEANFSSVAEEYQTLLLNHIEKENDILFPLAVSRLPKDQDEELFMAFERLEEERIGKGTHEQFHALLEQMLLLYLH